MFDLDFHFAFKHGKLLGNFSFHVLSVGNKILFFSDQWDVIKLAELTNS